MLPTNNSDVAVIFPLTYSSVYGEVSFMPNLLFVSSQNKDDSPVIPVPLP